MKSLKFKKVALFSLAFALALGAASLSACAEEDDVTDDWPTIGDGDLGETGGEDQQKPSKNFSSMKATYSKFNTTGSLVVTADFTLQSNKDALKALDRDVKDFLDRLENSLSTDVSTSYISRFNAAEPGSEVEVDELTYTVLSEAVEIYELTEGYYNPAVYYSVDLFGFSPRFAQIYQTTVDGKIVSYTYTAELSTRRPYDRLTSDGLRIDGKVEPDDHYVNIFKDLASHMSEVKTEEREGRYYVAKPDYTVEGLYGDEYSLALDLGGIGKGYAADIVTSLMKEHGFEYGYFNFGSSSVSMLASADPETNYRWEMDLINPDNSLGFYAIMYVDNGGLSTSGDYEKVYTSSEGNPYCHIIDPFTGKPKTRGIAALTLYGTSAGRADALTTALLVMGESKAVSFINQNLRDCGVAMIVRGDDGRCERVISNIHDLKYNPAYEGGNTLDEEGNIILK